MKRSRFSEEQIIAILKQHESGVSTADVCRVSTARSTSMDQFGRLILQTSAESAKWEFRVVSPQQMVGLIGPL